MAVITALDARAMIAQWGGVATLKRGAQLVPVLAAVIPTASQGQQETPGFFGSTDTETAIISSVTATGAPIALVPKNGDRFIRGARSWGINQTRSIDPDGGGSLVYVAELVR